mmetsp:Transcript_912/g.1589  ORF Transcript_912/g.1589 Transcript_912/m.1589 type:complete len:249 (-) Transcript_912:1238-1984(-)
MLSFLAGKVLGVRVLLLLVLLLQALQALLAQGLAGLVVGGDAGGAVECGIQVSLALEHLAGGDLVLFLLLAQTAAIGLLLLLFGRLLRLLALPLHAQHLGVLQLPHAHHVLTRTLVLHLHSQLRQHRVSQLVSGLQHGNGVLAHGRHAHLLAEVSERVQVRRQQLLLVLCTTAGALQGEANLSGLWYETEDSQHGRDVPADAGQHGGRHHALLDVTIGVAHQLQQRRGGSGCVVVIEQRSVHLVLGLF